MPGPLAYLRPTSIGEAVALLEEHGEDAKVVAGSTALTIMLRQRLIEPTALVSIGQLADPALREIRVDGDVLELGALVSHREVELNSVVREKIPVLAYTFGRVANVRVRNAATVGGVVAEADYASDPPAVLLALDAEVVAQGPEGTRTIPINEFFLSFYTTVLEHSEIVSAVRVPIPAPGTHAVYEKFITRSSEDRPCVGVMASVRLGEDRETIEDLRVAVGAAAEVPQRFPDLEAALQGGAFNEAVVRDIADGYADQIETLDDMRGSAWYRQEMVRVWVRRAIERAHAEAREGTGPTARA